MLKKICFYLSASVCGVVQGLSVAPHWALLQLVALAGFFYLLSQAEKIRQSLLLGLLFGLGWFCSSINWIYVSVHQYGGLPAVLAALTVVAVALLLSIFPLFASWLSGLWQKYQPQTRNSSVYFVFLLPAAWALSEWLRSWVLTGFPWAASAYAHIESPLSVFAPILGATGINYLCALIASLACLFVLSIRGKRFLVLNFIALFLIALLGSSLLLKNKVWSEPAETLSFRLIQGGIDQGEKFSPMGTEKTFQRYVTELNAPGLKKGTIVVMPETIFPIPLERVPQSLLSLLTDITKKGNPLIFGGFKTFGPRDYGNGAFFFENETDYRFYLKKHLVPFGEYVPFGFHWFVSRLGIPMADLKEGDGNQQAWVISQSRVAPMLCYEDLFSDGIAQWWKHDQNPNILMNLSNLAWFGNTQALPQHLGISRMRAMEFARPVVRATNTGATAAINEKGKVLAGLPFIKPGFLDVEVQTRQGRATPYARWGDLPSVLWFLLSLLTACVPLMRKHR